eukprot:sb/3476319/
MLTCSTSVSSRTGPKARCELTRALTSGEWTDCAARQTKWGANKRNKCTNDDHTQTLTDTRTVPRNTTKTARSVHGGELALIGLNWLQGSFSMKPTPYKCCSNKYKCVRPHISGGRCWN